jgi:GTPase SAR1 family protein
LLKLKIIGDIGTGKSSILLRFCEDTFYHGYYTNGVDFKIKTIKVDNLAVKLQIVFLI